MGKPARMPTASTAAAIGLTFGCFAILQDTRARLLGYKENDREVKVYGGMIKEEYQPNLAAKGTAMFPVATGTISDTVKPKPRYDNYD